ncbi:hypothetical protein WJU16_19785 [Chitinophaga pollutisoli]|uniref:Uncharacterized protein n=1 Tax=Chitinophaga pollutisoli TaxID=3133966 RepID=A0ABZ2YLE3_9BACT
MGPAGGTVEYPGARITLTIPAGALDNETEFFIQPITNTAPGGKGLAYRLQPEALTFKKPATLTIRFTAEDLLGTIPGALGIATQKADGIWYTVGALRNLANKTLSVQTTHFSDWSFFEAISLQPAMVAADPGQQVSLAVKCVLPGQDDLLEPLTPQGKETALLDPKTLLDPRYIEKWTLQGSGQLAGNTNTGKYTAPAQIPATNPALVTVDITSNENAVGILVSRIFTAPEGISVSVAGGGWTTYGNSGGHITSGESFVMAEQNGTTASVKWQGKQPGQWTWDLTNVIFLLNIGTAQTYAQMYNAGGQAVPSHGSLHVLETGSSGPWIIGSASMESAGHFIHSTPPVTTTTPVKAYFRVKRLN